MTASIRRNWQCDATAIATNVGIKRISFWTQSSCTERNKRRFNAFIPTELGISQKPVKVNCTSSVFGCAIMCGLCSERS